MGTVKLNIIIDRDWLEATWKEDETQIHCEFFSGHNQHIARLREKAKEFNTSLKEFEPLIKQCEDSFVYPIEEIEVEILRLKIQEANQYLAQTDWVNTYKIRHDLGLELILVESSKWEVINQREIYILFLKGL